MQEGGDRLNGDNFSKSIKPKVKVIMKKKWLFINRKISYLFGNIN